MLGNRGLVKPGGGHDLPYLALLNHEKTENLPASGFGDGVEGVGGSGGSCHVENNTFLYRNMSIEILPEFFTLNFCR
jgi:hypothetical protein